MESCTTAQPSGKWKSRKRRTWSLRCERVHGSGSEKGGEGCAIRCDGWQDKVFKCHEIQPSKAHEAKGRFARSLLATLSEGEGRQEREGGWRGRRTAVVLSDPQRLSLPHSRLPARSEKGAMMLGRLHCLSGPGPSASTRAATPPPPPPAILRPPRKRRHSQMGSDRPGQP